MATTPGFPNQQGTRTIPIGVYVAGGLVLVSLADTKVAPVAVAMLLAVAIYNANYLLNRQSPGVLPGVAGQSGLNGGGTAGGTAGGGGGGSW